LSHSQLRRSRGARALLREHLDRPGEPLALGHLVPGVGDLDLPTRADVVDPAVGGGQRDAGVDRILGGLREAEHQHHRACQEHKASDRGTGYDEASNGGLHILTC
jgi:hypothetical protein